MKTLLDKYLLRGVLRSPDDPPAPAPAPAAGAEPKPADAPSATGTLLGAAAAAAASAKEPVKTGEEGKEGVEPKPADKAAEPAAYVDDPAKTAEENAAAKKAHDDAAAAAAKPKEGEGKKDDDKPIDPASYKLEVPEGFVLHPEVDKEFRAFAAEHKLSQEGVDVLKAMQLKVFEKQAEMQAETVTKWGEDVKADKELGGPRHDEKMGLAGKAIAEFFPASLVKVLDSSGLGNYPDFVRGFYRIGLAMGEMPTFRANAGGSGDESVLDILYPKT